MNEKKITPIGGYFELELPHFPEIHAEAIVLNSGRFCLEYILRCRKYAKVYVPYFTCDSAIEPIVKLGILCQNSLRLGWQIIFFLYL